MPLMGLGNFVTPRHCRPQNRNAFLRFRPRLEALEDRMAPAVTNWINPAGGAWETASNWSTGALPGPADDVVISGLSAGATISHGSDNTSIHKLTTALSNPAVLAVSGGTLLVADSATLDVLTILSLTNGTIGGTANWEVDGPF